MYDSTVNAEYAVYEKEDYSQQYFITVRPLSLSATIHAYLCPERLWERSLEHS